MGHFAAHINLFQWGLYNNWSGTCIYCIKREITRGVYFLDLVIFKSIFGSDTRNDVKIKIPCGGGAGWAGDADKSYH